MHFLIEEIEICPFHSSTSADLPGKSTFFDIFRLTCESKSNHHYVIFSSVNRVFEKEIEVLRTWDYHKKLQNDLLYLLHLSDLKKLHYESSCGHFTETQCFVPSPVRRTPIL